MIRGKLVRYYIVWVATLLILTTLVSRTQAAPKYWVGSSANPTPNGTWDTATPNWNDQPNGSGPPVTWNDFDSATFSAGTGATGNFNVAVSGTQYADDITFEEGTATLNGGTLDVAGTILANRNATINSVLAASGANPITKAGGFTLTLNGLNTYTGGTVINAGAIAFGSDGAVAGNPYNLGQYPSTFDTDNVIINGGTLSLQTTSGARFLEPNRGIQIGPSGGTIEVNSNVTLVYGSDPTTGAGGIIGASGGGGPLIKRGPGEFRYAGAGTANSGFTQLVVEDGTFRLISQPGQTASETGFGAVPPVPTHDAFGCMPA